MRDILKIMFSAVVCLNTLGCSLKQNIPPNKFQKYELYQNKKITADLFRANSRIRRKAQLQVLNAPDQFIPPVLYFLSNSLYFDGEKDLASHWFYVGQIRARFDMNRSFDKTTEKRVHLLDVDFGEDINKYMFEYPGKLKETINKSLNYVQNNQELYDPSWIGFFGDLSKEFSKQEIYNLVKPSVEWPTIKQATLMDYKKEFQLNIRNSDLTNESPQKEKYTALIENFTASGDGFYQYLLSFENEELVRLKISSNQYILEDTYSAMADFKIEGSKAVLSAATMKNSSTSTVINLKTDKPIQQDNLANFNIDDLGLLSEEGVKISLNFIEASMSIDEIIQKYGTIEKAKSYNIADM